jgi:hypothetical protein
MKSHLERAILSAVLAMLLSCASTFAQGGGKAEPNRIAFARGASSATVHGRVRGAEEYEYSFEARQGQTIRIRLTGSPPNSVTAETRDPNAEVVALTSEKDGTLTATLAASGEFELTVNRREPNGRASSSYALTLTIH